MVLVAHLFLSLQGVHALAIRQLQVLLLPLLILSVDQRVIDLLDSSVLVDQYKKHLQVLVWDEVVSDIEVSNRLIVVHTQS